MFLNSNIKAKTKKALTIGISELFLYFLELISINIVISFGLYTISNFN